MNIISSAKLNKRSMDYTAQFQFQSITVAKSNDINSVDVFFLFCLFLSSNENARALHANPVHPCQVWLQFDAVSAIYQPLNGGIYQSLNGGQWIWKGIRKCEMLTTLTTTDNGHISIIKTKLNLRLINILFFKVTTAYCILRTICSRGLIWYPLRQHLINVNKRVQRAVTNQQLLQI